MAPSRPFSIGEQWKYRTPAGFESSRVVIGAIVRFAHREPIMCCAVSGAPRRLPDGSIEPVTIPFLPLLESALSATVTAPDGNGEVPGSFAASFDIWRNDERGLSAFSVPFEGRLDTLIARQMAEILETRL